MRKETQGRTDRIISGWLKTMPRDKVSYFLSRIMVMVVPRSHKTATFLFDTKIVVMISESLNCATFPCHKVIFDKHFEMTHILPLADRR